MKKILTAVILGSACATVAHADSYTNLLCRDKDDGKTYTLTVAGFDVHFCGKGEDGVLSGLGTHETNLRTIELKRLERVSGEKYSAEFLFGLENQACPRCGGNAGYEKDKVLECSLQPAREQLCRAAVHGPVPNLGAEYDKALRYGIGEDHWEPVPWITLYSGKDFTIYTFTGRNAEVVFTYAPGGYYKEYMAEADLKNDIRAKQAAGYKLHPYSTNPTGLAAAGRLLGYQLK